MPVDVLGARTPVHAYAEAFAPGTADALVPIAVQRGSTALIAAAAGALVVPAGKTLRLTSVELAVVLTGTTVATTRVRLRASIGTNPVALTSPIYTSQRLGGTTAVVAHTYVAGYKWAEGLEFPAGSGIGFSAISTAAMHTLDISLVGFEYTP